MAAEEVIESSRGAPESGFQTWDARAIDSDALAELFGAISGDPQFTPHAFTRAFIEWLRAYAGRDRYLVASWGSGPLLVYGMLRGWDEGYEVPSLGIAVHPRARGQGLGALMMRALHREAWTAGASSIRLRVHPENARALGMYARLGYISIGRERDQLVMLLRQTEGSEWTP